jgi:hypothetical protein
MSTVTVQGEIDTQGMLRLEVPCDLEPGPVEVTLTVRQARPVSEPDWQKLYGLGKEIWLGVNAVDYLRELREDRELPQ